MPKLIARRRTAAMPNSLAMGISLYFDADEGRFVELGCIKCHADVRGQLEVATPRRMYVAALGCPECGEQLVAFDVVSQEVA